MNTLNVDEKSEMKRKLYIALLKVAKFCRKHGFELKKSLSVSDNNILTELLLLQDFIQSNLSFTDLSKESLSLISDVETIDDLVVLLKENGFDDEVSNIQFYCEKKFKDVLYVFVYEDCVHTSNSRVDSFVINTVGERR